MSLSTITACTMSFTQAARHGDILCVGRELGTYVPRAEFSLMSAGYISRDTHTGETKTEGCKLSFTRWIDGIPHCARMLRGRGQSDEEVVYIFECTTYFPRASVSFWHHTDSIIH
jgi:hypothetical protein